jgi:hypothetical protein
MILVIMIFKKSGFLNFSLCGYGVLLVLIIVDFSNILIQMMLYLVISHTLLSLSV